MEGRSHLLVGLTAGVVLDSATHVTGDSLTMLSTYDPNVVHTILLQKAVFYFMVGIGALLPDIDNARSTLGHKLGWVSKEIQRLVGHRTLFHSFLGLILGSVLALGLGQLVTYLLGLRHISVPTNVGSLGNLIFIAVLFGCIMHIAADALTEAGVPLFWPYRHYYGFPPNRNWRFRTGTWPEHVIVWTFMILVGIGVWTSVISI